MSDLFLPPMGLLPPGTPHESTPFANDLDCSILSPMTSQKYSMYDVAAEDDPTIAWVRSLPSPSGGKSAKENPNPHETNMFVNSSLPDRPQSRFLETPHPILFDSYGAKDIRNMNKNLSGEHLFRKNSTSKIEKIPVKSSASLGHVTQNHLISQSRDLVNVPNPKNNLKSNFENRKQLEVQMEATEKNHSFSENMPSTSRDSDDFNLQNLIGSNDNNEYSDTFGHIQSIEEFTSDLFDTLEPRHSGIPQTRENASHNLNENNQNSIEFYEELDQSISNQQNIDASSKNCDVIQNTQVPNLKSNHGSSDNANNDVIIVENATATISKNRKKETSRKRKVSENISLNLKRIQPIKDLVDDDVIPTTPLREDLGSVLLTPRSEINEEDKRSASVRSACSSVTNEMAIARETKVPDKKLLGDIVRRYLRKREDMRVVILHAKVAQKSYGSEKRFFCPPPCVHLLGSGWKTKHRRRMTSALSSPVPSPGGNTSSSSSSLGVAGATEICLYMGVGGGENELQQITLDSPEKNYAAAKTLHTPDSDKRKHFEIHVKMFYGDGAEIGLFHSQRIKVISKPSKKKQSVKNTELCIPSGSKVSLFNRLRSQTVSTRYLHATREGYRASASHWGSFAIHILDDDHPESDVFSAEDGYIHYGTTVKLVCTITGYSLPRLIIRKVERQKAIMNSDEPVSQLHKCALYLKDTDRQYICLSQEKIIVYKAKPCPKYSNNDVLTDGACWTIISTEKSEYCWSDSAFNLVNNDPVTPVPVVKNLEINGGGAMAMAEIIGENFKPSLKIWFANVESETYFRSEECMVCMVPEISKIHPGWRYVKKMTKVPLLLVRNDGVIYPCGVNFYYTPEPGPNAEKQPSIKEILKKRSFLQFE